jgi:hypothetical protein
MLDYQRRLGSCGYCPLYTGESGVREPAKVIIVPVNWSGVRED